MLEIAQVAFGLARVADFATVMNELVREADPAVLWKDFHQRLFDLLRSVAFGETEAVGDAEDVCVDDDSFSLVEADAEDDIGGFACGAGDSDELCECLRNFAVEVFTDFLSRALNRLGFIAKEAGGFDELFKIGQRCVGHGLRSGEAFEERGRNHVDTHVCALRGEDGRNEQFPGRAMIERALDVGIGFIETFEDGGDAVGGEVIAGSIWCALFCC